MMKCNEKTQVGNGYIRQGTSKSPYGKINCVPTGYAFDEKNAPENSKSLTVYKPNRKEFLLECLAHLNILKQCLSKRFNRQFFKSFFLHLKYLDKAKTGWLPKEVVYNHCSAQYVRVEPKFIEPLLEMWNGFDGSQIEYKIFVYVIDYKNSLPGSPKIADVEADCLQYSTTYNDMVMPGQKVDMKPMAGLPSGGHFDTWADQLEPAKISHPEESDMKICVKGPDFTNLGITHHDLYAKRSRELVRKVFETIGEKFTDREFNEYWEEAKKYHSQGHVSFETFKRALCK